MGAESSAPRDGRSQKDASASESASGGELKVLREDSAVLDAKPLQKNGQISSMTSLNGHSEDNTLADVGQPDGVSVAQKEDTSETMDAIQDEVAPQVNGEKVDKESPDTNDISTVEEKAAEEKPDEASEVGFKKIFRFVGFKFTLKKDKSEEKDPVKLLTVKDKEGEKVSATDEPAKEEAATAEEKSTAEEKETETEASTAEAEVTKDADNDETTDAPTEGSAADATEEAAMEDGAEKDDKTTSPSQEPTQSPFKKFFTGGLFSNLRKRASIKKAKEVAVEQEAANTEEAAVEESVEKVATEQETKEERSEAKEKPESKKEAPTSPKEPKSEAAPESEVSVETHVPTETTTDETKQEDQKAEAGAEEEKAPAEAELLSSQEKTKPQGSPLKKLFTGAGLKKLSTKKQRSKKETESKPTESGERAVQQLQYAIESSEPTKADSGPSSPEESGDRVIAVDVTQNESNQETEEEVAADGENKKEGIIAWSSFKKLVTPKKRVKRASESDDEATGDKPAKSATLSSSESAALADKSVEEEAKEEKPSEEEPKTENTEKLVSSTEEPKRKMDTSVSWEALMCMGGPKKRMRKTSDSDDDETKIEEEVPAAKEGELEGKTEAAIVTTESEGEAVSSPEPQSPPDRESTWDTLKRMVMPKNKSKSEEKPEEPAEQVQSDSEAPKDESAFSLRKFFPGRRKKKTDKQGSADQGSGEEDSDTPAVVPLSEYEKQDEAELEASAEEEAPAEEHVVQIKVSAEDRAPSWIPATVEDADDKHDQLSDIPEEAENAATPKSVDTDIIDDETEIQAAFLRTPGRTGRRLSTAEVMPVPSTPDAATTPVPRGPKSERGGEIMAAVEAQITVIPSRASVTVQDVPIEVADANTEPELPTERATSMTNTILAPHAHDEAVAICTGLGTKEIAKVALEKPATGLYEPVTVIRDALSTEESVDDKPASAEEAALTVDEVVEVQVLQVKVIDLEPTVENSESGVADVQVATESVEPEIEMVGLVSTALDESEVIQMTQDTENSPKDVTINAISPMSETAVSTQTVKVSEVTVETKEVDQVAAAEEKTSTKDVDQTTVPEEMSSTITVEPVPDLSALIPSEASPIIKETVVLIAPASVESDKAETTDVVMEKVSEPVGVEPIQGQETKEEGAVVEAVTAQLVISDVTEQVSEKMEEIKEEAQQSSEIEAHSKVIAQSVIQDAVDKVSEDAPKPKSPETPSATTPEKVQAIATTEKEVDISTETPVITDTPVPQVCEKPAARPPKVLCAAMEVIDTIPIEVTGSLGEEEEEKEVEEKKPEDRIKKAVEVQVSEETVVEEVVEINAGSQTDGEPKEVKEEESKEDQEPEVKEAAKDVKSQSEEIKSEAPSEESKAKGHEIHIPVQVVLQSAQVVEEPSVEEEAVEEFGSNGHETEDAGVAAKKKNENKLPVLTEEPPATGSEEEAAPSEVTDAATSQAETEKAATTKCAEVMAQVIEVIEEAVKEIEPVSAEITAAS